VDYLVAQAEDRSAGAIRFPWVMQQGYAWFTNRIYGLPGGQIFGQPAGRLLLDGKGIRVDNTMVDWLAARAEDRVWLVLMSQADEPIRVAPKLDAERLGLKPGAAITGYSPQRPDGVTLPADALDGLAVPPRGVVAVSPPAESRDEFPHLPPLKQGHVKQSAGEPWGDLHAFRIRSPFGDDSIYVALTGGPVDGRVSLKAGSTTRLLEKRSLPYEFSIHPWPIDRPCELTIECRTSSDAEPRTLQLTLPGTP
jgi:hypothetical protein